MSKFPAIEERINYFEGRIETDGRAFCEDLFDHATKRLLSHKYSYYVLDNSYIDDCGYDHEEKSWYVMGRALGMLKEDETSPCVGFDYNHPLAKHAEVLAKSFIKK